MEHVTQIHIFSQVHEEHFQDTMLGVQVLMNLKRWKMYETTFLITVEWNHSSVVEGKLENSQ